MIPATKLKTQRSETMKPADKKWSELSHEEVQHFFRVCSHRAEMLSENAQTVWMEFAKYLFAVNSAAAAGLFVLLRSSPGDIWLSLGFGSFCAGTLFVGLGYFILAKWLGELSDGWTEDFNAWGRDELTIAELDHKNRTRHASPKKRVIKAFLIASLLLLVAGGVVTAKPLWPRKASVPAAAHGAPSVTSPENTGFGKGMK
jgi:hypothetical protein